MQSGYYRIAQGEPVHVIRPTSSFDNWRRGYVAVPRRKLPKTVVARAALAAAADDADKERLWLENDEENVTIVAAHPREGTHGVRQHPRHIGPSERPVEMRTCTKCGAEFEAVLGRRGARQTVCKDCKHARPTDVDGVRVDRREKDAAIGTGEFFTLSETGEVVPRIDMAIIPELTKEDTRKLMREARGGSVWEAEFERRAEAERLAAHELKLLAKQREKEQKAYLKKHGQEAYDALPIHTETSQ
jgi:hypothetical protein